ncbi:Uncharacterised protein [Amycolatopsis camponoti]|uniref:Uncharacterized protein n=1 Tax=Amycolatopsis camponoti TaxID=2606593 RepID=A0A6I8LK18_9PSEU|nr:Uncharacterised protein [Amycolatopsis camponoti]
MGATDPDGRSVPVENTVCALRRLAPGAALRPVPAELRVLASALRECSVAELAVRCPSAVVRVVLGSQLRALDRAMTGLFGPPSPEAARLVRAARFSGRRRGGLLDRLKAEPGLRAAASGWAEAVGARLLADELRGVAPAPDGADGRRAAELVVAALLPRPEDGGREVPVWQVACGCEPGLARGGAVGCVAGGSARDGAAGCGAGGSARDGAAGCGAGGSARDGAAGCGAGGSARDGAAGSGAGSGAAGCGAGGSVGGGPAGCAATDSARDGAAGSGAGSEAREGVSGEAGGLTGNSAAGCGAGSEARDGAAGGASGSARGGAAGCGAGGVRADREAGHPPAAGCGTSRPSEGRCEAGPSSGFLEVRSVRVGERGFRVDVRADPPAELVREGASLVLRALWWNGLGRVSDDLGHEYLVLAKDPDGTGIVRHWCHPRPAPGARVLRLESAGYRGERLRLDPAAAGTSAEVLVKLALTVRLGA